MMRKPTDTLSETADQSKKEDSHGVSLGSVTSRSGKKTDARTDDVDLDSENQLDAVALLKEDHRKVEKLFQEYESAENPEDKKRLSEQICKELIVHTELEEELFYPACRAEGVEDDKLDEAQVEHDGAKVLITQLITLSVESAYFDAKVKVLSEYIKHHVGEEEKSSDGIFAKARSAGVDMTALGKRLQSRKKEILAQGDKEILRPPIPRSLETPDFIHRSFKENQAMANYQNRDDQGRFTDNGNQGPSGGRYANDQYDDRYGGSSNSQYRSRDEYGRFMGNDDHRGSGYGDRDQHETYARSGGGRSDRNYNDDYSSNRQGRGQGWYGDPEGHAQAARRGNSGYDDDQGNYRYSGNRGGQGQGHGGWFGDPEGHAEAGRHSHQSSRNYGRGGYRDEQDDYRYSGSRGGQGQGHGGWFGDPEGHADAGRHSHRSSGNYGHGGYRDDQDDYRYSGSGQRQGHGGWFGDSEGHSEAARRGWENR